MAKAHTTWKVLPHGPIEKLSDRLWRVEGSLEGIDMKRVMTVAKKPDGTLVVHNGIALGDAEMAEIDAWGKVTTIVVPNSYHRLDARVFADRYPEAEVICPKGAEKKVNEVVQAKGHSARSWSIVRMPGTAPEPNDNGVELVVLEGTKQREGAMIVHGEITSLVLNDAVFNMPHLSGFTGFVLKSITGSTGGPRISRLMRWFVIADKAAFRAHLEKLAALPNLAHVVVSHHEVIRDDPAGTLRRVAATL